LVSKGKKKLVDKKVKGGEMREEKKKDELII